MGSFRETEIYQRHAHDIAIESKSKKSQWCALLAQVRTYLRKNDMDQAVSKLSQIKQLVEACT